MSRTDGRRHGWTDDEAAGGRYIDVYGTDHDDILVGTTANERFYPYLAYDGVDKVDGSGGDDILKVDYHGRQATMSDYTTTIYGQQAGDYAGSLYGSGSEVDFQHIDRIDFRDSSSDDFVQIFSSVANLRIDGGAGHDMLLLFFDNLTADTTLIHRHGALDFMGGHFAHFEDFTIRLGSGDDTIEFGKGNDPLVGNRGDDVLNGGGGNDYLVGGSGADLLIGGHGADTFAFWNITDFATGEKLDEIKHFSRAQGDKIELKYIDADPGSAGDQAFSITGTEAFTGRAGSYELRYEKTGRHDFLVQIDTNHDKVADLAFVVHAHDLQPGDFVG